jgi:hypothetical protein
MATTTKLFKKNTHEIGASDPILTRIVAEDKVPWYRKPNLRYLYFMLFPTCMGIELTSGFDSQLINALQIVPSWIDCMQLPPPPELDSNANLMYQTSTTLKGL